MNKLDEIKKMANAALDAGRISDETVAIMWLVRELERAADLLSSADLNEQYAYGHLFFELNHSETVALPGKVWDYNPRMCDHLRRDGEEILNEKGHPFIVCGGCGLIATDVRIQTLNRCDICGHILDVPYSPGSVNCDGTCQSCTDRRNRV
jgi:hypothetical protein